MCKMNFKIKVIFALGAMLSFSSCSKEADLDTDTVVIKLSSFTASLEGNDQTDLKSYQIGCALLSTDDEKHGIHNRWNNEDDISVILASYKKQQYSGRTYPKTAYLQGNEQDNGFATFGFGNEESFTLTNFNISRGDYAYFFAAENGNFTDDKMIFTIKSEQTYNGSLNDCMPMIAYSSLTTSNGNGNSFTVKKESVNFTFTNLASMIRFDVTPATGKKLESIAVKCKDKNICGEGGEAFYSRNNNSPVKLNVDYKLTGDSITLNCTNAPVVNNVQSYAMVIAPLLDDEVELTFYIKVNGNITKKTAQIKKLERNHFKKIAIDLANF